jgi:hypothetical protein
MLHLPHRGRGFERVLSTAFDGAVPAVSHVSDGISKELIDEKQSIDHYIYLPQLLRCRLFLTMSPQDKTAYISHHLAFTHIFGFPLNISSPSREASNPSYVPRSPFASLSTWINRLGYG